MTVNPIPDITAIAPNTAGAVTATGTGFRKQMQKALSQKAAGVSSAAESASPATESSKPETDAKEPKDVSGGQQPERDAKADENVDDGKKSTETGTKDELEEDTPDDGNAVAAPLLQMLMQSIPAAQPAVLADGVTQPAAIPQWGQAAQAAQAAQVQDGVQMAQVSQDALQAVTENTGFFQETIDPALAQAANSQPEQPAQAQAVVLPQNDQQEAGFVKQALKEIEQAVARTDAERTVAAVADGPEEPNAGIDTEAGDELFSARQSSDNDKKSVPESGRTASASMTEAFPAPQAGVKELSADPLPKAAADAGIEDKTVQQTMLQSIVDEVSSAADKGRSELFIRLKPETLGGLAVHLSLAEGGLSAKLSVSNKEVLSAINSEITQLEASLRDKGIQVVQMDLVYEEMASGQYLAGQQSRQFSGGGGSSGQKSYRAAANPESDDSVYGNLALLGYDDVASVDYSA